MTETKSSGTHEERPKVNWFLWAASAFFGIMFLGLWDLPNSTGKWLWLVIAGLNLIANIVQINNTRSTRYVLWKRGLSIYMGKTREALVRFDKAMVFRQYKSHNAARAEMRELGVEGGLRSFPAFGSRRRWLVIFEREDGGKQAFIFDPSPYLENSFRRRLIDADDESAERAAAQSSPSDAGLETPAGLASGPVAGAPAPGEPTFDGDAPVDSDAPPADAEAADEDDWLEDEPIVQSDASSEAAGLPRVPPEGAGPEPRS